MGAVAFPSSDTNTISHHRHPMIAIIIMKILGSFEFCYEVWLVDASLVDAQQRGI